MRRRDLVVALAGAITTWPLRAVGQTSPVPKVGFLVLPRRIPPSEPYFAAFNEGMADGGYVDGRTVRVEYRYADDNPERLASLALDLVRSGVAVIVTPSGTPAVLAAEDATKTIPIIGILGEDLIQRGLVASLSRPGGNITGVIANGAQLIAKQIELVYELGQSGARIGVLIDAAFTPEEFEKEAISAGGKLGCTIVHARIANDGDFSSVFAMFEREQIRSLVVGWAPFLVTRHERITEFATRSALPDMYAPADVVARGGLMSYGPSFPLLWHQLGTLTGKIIGGAIPAEQPVELPTRIEMRINLKVAKALGIDIPQSVLLRADQVIE
jgi:putative ABC transport system substrate-binding protein